MDALAAHARGLVEFGVAFAEIGERFHATWQGLAAVYQAPEAGQLLAATAPVAHVSAAVGEDYQAVGRVVERYAGEVRQIQARLDALRAQAGDFEASVDGDDDWADDDAKRERSNELVAAVNTAMADFHDAERRCANGINALYGGQQYRASDGDGRQERGEYGAAAGSEEGVPWGKPVDDEPSLASSIGHGILDVAGLIPVVGEPADGINALWYGAEGDALNASLSAAGMVPIGGWFATGAKVGIKGGKAATKGADDAAPHSPVAPQGGLRRHDNAGGHTLDPDRAHVGASDDQLRDRLAQPRIRESSSYYDRAAAERAASENITGNADQIQRWAQSEPQTKAFNWQHDQPVGRYANEGADEVRDVSGSRVVLRRDPSMPEGYRIQTTFPKP